MFFFCKTKHHQRPGAASAWRHLGKFVQTDLFWKAWFTKWKPKDWCKSVWRMTWSTVCVWSEIHTPSKILRQCRTVRSDSFSSSCRWYRREMGGSMLRPPRATVSSPSKGRSGRTKESTLWWCETLLEKTLLISTSKLSVRELVKYEETRP